MLVTSPLFVGACGDGGNSIHRVTAPHADGLLTIQTITYRSSFDGTNVTALVATPSRGWVIWQFGVGSKKEDSSAAWQGPASLGLTTFSSDFRDDGALASSPGELERAIRNPNTFGELIRGTCADLHSAIDYLVKQPYCRQNTAYVGVSLGGVTGTMVAGTDKHVKAAVLVVTPWTFRVALTSPGEPILPGIARDPAKLAAALRIWTRLDSSGGSRHAPS
jgi:hypothetical protein